MRHHSALDGTRGDRVIIGATSMKHLEANAACFSAFSGGASEGESDSASASASASVSASAAGPLPQEIVQGFDEAWRAVRGAAPGYVRGVVLSSERPADMERLPEVTR